MSFRTPLLLALVLVAAPVLAQSGLKPLPTPDLSGVPAATATQLRKARADFDRAREIVTGEALAENYGILAGSYARAGFTDVAAVALDDAITLAPRDTRWMYARGVLALAAGQDAEATRLFERAWAISKAYLPLRTALANQKMGTGDLDGARRLLEEYVARDHGQAVPYAMLGDIALKQKRYTDAIRYFDQALKLQPEADRLYADLSTAYAANGDAKAAAAAKAKVGTRAPVLPDPVASRLLPETGKASAGGTPANPSQQAIGTAMLATSAGDYLAARKALDEALRSDPKDATLLAVYARVESTAGRLEAAQVRADAAVRADPSNILAQLALGSVAEMRGNDAAAERAYGDAIRLDPAAVNPRFALGVLLQRLGRSDAAEAQFRAILKIEAANPAAWTQLVALESAAGRCAKALKEINAAMSAAPDHPHLMQLFVRLASTCPGTSKAEQRMALDYAGKLYAAGGSMPAVAEAYALALAANGRWDDAVATQQGAMFSVLRSDGSAALVPYREILEQFQAHKLPTRPWAASDSVYHPRRPTPDVPPQKP